MKGGLTLNQKHSCKLLRIPFRDTSVIVQQARERSPIVRLYRDASRCRHARCVRLILLLRGRKKEAWPYALLFEAIEAYVGTEGLVGGVDLLSAGALVGVVGFVVFPPPGLFCFVEASPGSPLDAVDTDAEADEVEVVVVEDRTTSPLRLKLTFPFSPGLSEGLVVVSDLAALCCSPPPPTTLASSLLLLLLTSPSAAFLSLLPGVFA